MKNLPKTLGVGALLLLFFTACIKDTDFNQADDISLQPVVEVNLIHFDVTAGNFFDTITSTSILTVRDTTDLRFLNEGAGDGIRRAEFYFKFTNSIPRDFEIVFRFLSEQNDTTYTTQTTVAQGTVPNPIITEFFHNIETAEIEQLTQASKVVVSATIPSSNATLEGNLNLQSKTTYYLEF